MPTILKTGYWAALAKRLPMTQSVMCCLTTDDWLLIIALWQKNTHANCFAVV
jgi:hypothetical protein